ncbi:MAG: hypothetical protein EOQ62_21095 [Mesorhizobium sp.]|nr:hypothetical protein EJ078_09640 [Mesorhizobium sp. M1A.F.Ca.IN.022.06.1.1]RWG44381.1 MAG: hypothetical protein EOQ62_21095 [Mesorhizobium sp.]
MLEAEMDEALGSSKNERTSEPLGYRSGYYYGRSLVSWSASRDACRACRPGRSRRSRKSC